MQFPYYVYEHKRKDNGKIFYVGKGKGNRAKAIQAKSKYWHNVVKSAGGYDISILVSGLDEELAYFAESERIHQLKSIGVRLCNLTNGGEGMTGHKRSPETNQKIIAKQKGQKRPSVSEKLKGRKFSEETILKMKEAFKGRVIKDETRIKLSIAGKGRVSSMKGKKHKPETIDMIRKSCSITLSNPDIRKKISENVLLKYKDENHKEKVRKGTIKALSNPDVRRKMSESHKGDKHPFYGKPVPLDRKMKQIATLKARPRVTCPYCDLTLDEANAKRWHFDKCKKRG